MISLSFSSSPARRHGAASHRFVRRNKTVVEINETSQPRRHRTWQKLAAGKLYPPIFVINSVRIPIRPEGLVEQLLVGYGSQTAAGRDIF